MDEPDRKTQDIQPADNPLGMLVALFLLAHDQQYRREHKLALSALEVFDDSRFSDHILIQATHLEGENEGGMTTRFVVIHKGLPGLPKQTVRFYNYTVEEEVTNLTPWDVPSLGLQVMRYFSTGETV
jgi:hypothetical protein